MLEVCFLEEAEEKAAVTTPQSALHSLQRSRREIRFSTKLPQCFLPNLDIFVFFRPFYFSVRLSVFFISLLPKLNKNNVVGARFVKVITWSCLSCDMDLSKLLHGFAKFVSC